jgi:hypothetical protein
MDDGRMTDRFGTADKVTEAMEVLTLIQPHLAAVTGGSHQPLTLDSTVEDILTMSPAQVLSKDAAVVRGDIIYADSTPKLTRLAKGNANDFLRIDAGGNDVEWRALASTDLTHDLLSATHSDTNAQAVTRGSLVYGNATPAWDELTHPGGAGWAFTTDATDVMWDQTPTWTGSHTWDDGTGDSPSLIFVGGSNDDTISVFLDDNATANDSDLVIRLCAADDDSVIYIQDNVPANNIFFAANGDISTRGRLDCGDTTLGVSTTVNFRSRNTYTDTSGSVYGGNIIVDFDPSGNFSTTVYANQVRVDVGTAFARTGGTLRAFNPEVIVTNNVAASDLVIQNIYARVDIEDAAATDAEIMRIVTPAVDGGSITSSYGLRVVQGSVGGGSITTLAPAATAITRGT